MFRFSNKKALGQSLKCRVQLLVPGESLEISYDTNSTGQDILNDAAQQLDLTDKDYYGLKLYDQIQWLDLSKSVVKQTKGVGNIVFVLRFKYYPAEPALLANESTRYYLYLQLRADLLEGRLRSDSHDTLAYLIACVMQSELGDATSKTNTNQQNNYVSEFKFVPNQSDDLEMAAIRLHQSEDFLGLTPSDAELNFLKKACQLDTYGVDPYPVKDGNSHKHFLIGVNHRGILTFQDSKLTNLFVWGEIDRITLDSKLVVVHCRKIERKGEKSNKIRSMFAFRCPSHEHAQNFWKISTEHKYFFTLDSTPDTPIVTNTGGLFKKSHKLKYVGRVEKDLLRDHVDEGRSSNVKRSRSLMAKTNNGSLWQGFKQANGNNLQTSMNNIYSADSINKTIPANMNYFREEDEDECEESASGVGEGKNAGGTQVGRTKGRASLGSLSKDSPKTFNRKPVLTTKLEASASAIRRGSQIYMDTEQNDHDFVRASIILFITLASIFVVILLINDSDRPNSLSLILRKLNLEHVSVAMRQNYYLPLQSAVKTSFGRIFTILDSKLL
uniref:FERM domain-containing protein 5 n=1 Tax=Aceria tosichella TaxID=561515 RepID=A0A6G1SL93_9ACAR